MMISANGMVPAGFVNFSTHQKSPYEQFEVIQPLERCEDARAQIKFMHMYENCTRTPIEHSYINHLIAKQDRLPYENGTQASRVYPASSHSLNRENFSLRKQRHRDTENHGRVPQPLFTKPLVSPRMITRNSEPGTTDKAIIINSFRKEADEIAEEKEPNDSSINPLTKEQLMKEHQEYWLEIVRMEEEMECTKEESRRLKEESRRLKEDNAALKGESVAMKEYYEGHEEKIHAFVGEIEENSDTIKRLETEVKEYKGVIAQKDELEK
jgi:FtsZ-binding cell division protein ZapB